MTDTEQQGSMGHRGSSAREHGPDGDEPSLDAITHINNRSMSSDDAYLQHRRVTDFREPYRCGILFGLVLFSKHTA